MKNPVEKQARDCNRQAVYIYSLCVCVYVHMIDIGIPKEYIHIDNKHT